MGAWTDDELRYLATHYKGEYSAARIGAHLGRTRNSVIGKAFRCGMCLPSGAWARGRDPVTPLRLQMQDGVA